MKPIITLILIAILFVGCSGSPQKRIIGTWSEVKGDDTITFYADGTLYVRDNDDSVGGNYHFIDKQHIRIEFRGISGGLLKFAEIFTGVPPVFEVTFTRTTLILVAPDGDTSEFKRKASG